MKKFCFILTFILSLTCYAQKNYSQAVNIDRIPKEGLLLDKGWKYYMRDDAAFANTDYDDRNWQTLNPSLNRPQLPNAVQKGIGWLRIRLSIPSALRRTVLLNIYENSAALEIYLNGNLIGRRGIIDSKSKTGLGFIDIRPLELGFTNENQQVIAIRFAQQQNLHFINGYLLPLFISPYLTNIDAVLNVTHNIETYHVMLDVCASVLMLLAAFHLFFWYYNRKRSANLYFALALVFGGVSYGMFSLFSVNRSQYVELCVYAGIFAYAANLTGVLYAIKALNSLFYFKQRKWLIWVSLSLFSFLLWLFAETFHGSAIYIITLLINCNLLWIVLKAIYYKKSGAWILAGGFSGLLIGALAISYLMFLNGYDPAFWTKAAIAVGISILSPSFGISMYLSREYALDSLLLQVKLSQVEELSAANIAQEKEKQQILANQNAILDDQVTKRTAELNRSLNDLKSAQSQLVHREKMASLGELTAGIAHEIQNPLNFVNNFSEISTEMMDELDEELNKGDVDAVKAIATDIKENLEKICHHGQRADAIVKGMLQHSRTSSGQKEPTNLNALVDEYLRLAYHGLQAKDKNFNAELITHFDQKLPKVDAVPQNIGRVLLNVINNAFYAVQQKAKFAEPNYKPTVEISTAQLNGSVIMSVKDNGDGIPDTIKQKIMQPFFTTKPTGLGTGLGLSLSYDIVNAHGGDISFESQEGIGTEFTVVLPGPS